jgi:hypothetical protein
MGLGVHGGTISIPGSDTSLPPIRLSLPSVPTTGIAAHSGDLPMPHGGIAEPVTPEPSTPTTEVLGEHTMIIPAVLLMILNTVATNVPEPPEEPNNQSVPYDADYEEPSWPKETELYIMPGTSRVTLTTQRPLIRTVIQDAIDFVRASMMFDHAFPDGMRTFYVIRDALVAAAASHRPQSSSIHNRLLLDEHYVDRIIPLVSLES